MIVTGSMEWCKRDERINGVGNVDRTDYLIKVSGDCMMESLTPAVI